MAHKDFLVTDQLGARYPETRLLIISSRIVRDLKRSSLNSSGVLSYMRSWPYPWLAISCPASDIFFTRCGNFSATQPRTKNVALELDPPSILNIFSVFACTLISYLSQSEN